MLSADLAPPALARPARDVTERLAGEIDANLAPLLPALAAEPFALLDFPNHGNVGDSAIWLGELSWLQRRAGRGPALTCHVEERPGRLPPGPILLHGGGNFGDIWPQHQLFREAVLDRHRGHPVVQMPQSIHYADPSAIDRAARAIERHGAFTLLVRDRPSLELARRHFPCEVRLCPDMAFALGPLPRPAAPSLEGLMLLRTDREGVGQPVPALPQGWRVEDWLEDDPAMYRTVLTRTRRTALLSLDPRRLTRRARSLHMANQLAEWRLRRGVAQLSRARFVITDRLHVHIVATLLGLPHVFLDNSYGKIGRFSEAFGTLWDGASRADTLAEAMERARAHRNAA
ncbi:polysaccharide pyruvyl transferase family protein [Cereibacter sediminicola]|uniref:polysaccharide pyruvyl transferase family protein n=1 Tax=Cereibacter sediminicola TaxID=2584941 RepID=UPI0016435F2D|nr:polysaccharide pyruvyl transferase family protein [Cereibacter sediminicola]